MGNRDGYDNGGTLVLITVMTALCMRQLGEQMAYLPIWDADLSIILGSFWNAP